MGSGVHPSQLNQWAGSFDILQPKDRTNGEGQSCQHCPFVVSLSNHVSQR